MASNNFSSEKRRKEQAKKAKKEAKKQRKLDEAAVREGEATPPAEIEAESP